MSSKFANIKICGIEATVPTMIESNERYVDILGEKRVRKQTRMTGVETRRINDTKQSTADLCKVSAEVLLNKLKWDRQRIKFLVFVTQNPSVVIPSTAFILQMQLGLPLDSFVFDVNLGCSGYVAGIRLLSSLLQQEQEGTKGLLLVGDVQRTQESESIEYTLDEEADRMLFGSAGSATAIEVVKEHDIDYMDKSDGSRFSVISRYKNEACQMDGEQVFMFAINDVVEYCKEFFKSHKINLCDIDYFVFHQAQKFMLKNVVDILDIPEEKVLYSLKDYGNTSSASIPLTLCANREQLPNKEVKIFMCGFGVGLACSCMVLDLDSKVIGEVIESDEYTKLR